MKSHIFSLSSRFLISTCLIVLGFGPNTFCKTPQLTNEIFITMPDGIKLATDLFLSAEYPVGLIINLSITGTLST